MIKAKATVARSHPPTEKASVIYEYAVASATSLWLAFDLAKHNRGNPRGITTDQEQDLLRAMLVMAASGLDAALKQLIRECLPALVACSDGVHTQFEKFTLRRLQGAEDATSAGPNLKFLAKVLAAPDHQASLIDSYVYELTGESLQSAQQVLKTAAALGLDSKAIVPDQSTLKAVFTTRNQIIHELDMNLTGPVRKRRVRSQTQMKKDAELLLATAARAIEAVDKALGA